MSSYPKAPIRVVATLCMVLAAGFGVAAETGLEQGRALLQGGKPDEAYAVLAPLEFERAGDLEYDYLLGVAALDSGRPDKATLAFERVLAANPNHSGARMDIARAYFALGNDAEAKVEFETILGQNPPPLAKNVALKYLAAIEERAKSNKTRLTGYLAAGIGHDDNVTSVTTNFTPAALATYGVPYLPTGNAVTHSSLFSSLEAGFEINAPASETLAWFAGLDAKRRSYVTRHSYDTDTVDGRVGLNLARGNNLYRLSVIGQSYAQEGEAPTTPKQTSDRNMLGVSAEWRRTLDASNQLGAFLQYNEQSYPDTPTGDVEEYLLGASWLHAYAGAYKPVIFLSVFEGQDRAKTRLGNGSDVSKSFTGARLGGQFSLGATTDIYASLGYQWRDDDRAYARSNLIAHGQDVLADLTLGVNWRFGKDWSLQPQLAYMRNQSNIPTAEFERTQVSLLLRRDFR